MTFELFKNVVKRLADQRVSEECATVKPLNGLFLRSAVWTLESPLGVPFSQVIVFSLLDLTLL